MGTREGDVSPVILFDVRVDDSHEGYIAAVNRGLESEPDGAYLSRFGPVGSDRWWACCDRGELPVKILAGKVTFVGERIDTFTDETEDVVEFVADGQPRAYGRTDHWASAPIQVGDDLRIARTSVEVQTPTGPCRYIIDLRAEWFPASRHA
ncbi:hypothetical protein Mal4_57530 [Maioricimonas rarisocia]|uniref:Uncharacterized protein n=1 Tax=Maioricimonas rarisocia TaxID=2528026 RepID=A0A517ZFY2_9PLAN|nr:hypothetical protein [Maioricimonas rarisocia]QDU41386.1 hypothetical protein Mal4_57530 [Maioricimonas rarisocia]